MSRCVCGQNGKNDPVPRHSPFSQKLLTENRVSDVVILDDNLCCYPALRAVARLSLILMAAIYWCGTCSDGLAQTQLLHSSPTPFVSSPMPSPRGDLFERSDIPPQVIRINEQFESIWAETGLRPSSEATDFEWCRRVHLDLIGRIPTVDELQSFVQDKAEDKRLKLVNRLLYDDFYTEEIARNWTTLWTNLLIGRTGGNANNSMISRSGMQKYLRDSFARNKPYDQLARELITATGSAQPEAPDFNGATNFLIDKVNMENAAQATAATSRIFLGVQVQCTQCHNHPFNDWKQQKYWEFNAFFRQVRGFRGATDAESPKLVDQDFRGESGNIDEADLFFELRNGLLKVAYPVFFDGTALPRSGYVQAVNRREKVSELIVQSPWFAQAQVNRIWEHFLGYGFTKPVDDLGSHNPPAYPDLFDYLSEEFRNSGYDLRRLMAWVVLSKPYSLSSKSNKGNERDDPLLGLTPAFSHFYLRQMRAEELYESLQIASGAGTQTGSYEEQEARKNRWLQQFATEFGTDEGDETTQFNGTIPQVLMMFNGEMVRSATAGEPGSVLAKLFSEPGTKYQDAVDYLFLAGLSRPAKKSEREMAQLLLQARQGDTREALRDVWWVVLNSNQFLFNY